MQLLLLLVDALTAPDQQLKALRRGMKQLQSDVAAAAAGSSAGCKKLHRFKADSEYVRLWVGRQNVDEAKEGAAELLQNLTLL